MIFYQLTDRTFSRIWRRNKDYTEKQLNLLAKRHGCVLEKFKGGLRVNKGGKVAANFRAVQGEAQADRLREANPKIALYAALRRPARDRIIVHNVRSAT